MAGFRRAGWLLDRIPYRNAALLEAALGKHRVVLDIGGGTGRVARKLSYERVVVCDPEPALLRRARGKGLAAVRCDARALPFRDGAVGGAFAVDALHHIPDHGRVLAEARRVLAPRGRLVIEEFDPATLLGGLLARLEDLAGFDSRFRRPADLRAEAEGAGLRARVERWGRKEYTVVGERAE